MGNSSLCNPSSSVGTAHLGIAPGSVKVVLAWDDNASVHNVQYIDATNELSLLFLASSVTVNAEYTNDGCRIIFCIL